MGQKNGARWKVCKVEEVQKCMMYAADRIQGSLSVGNCFGNVPFTGKQYIINTSVFINNDNLKCFHAVKIT